MPYVGRFAPSPTGALHAGSLATALASWLDARAHGGQWLVRIEDVDTTRCQSEWGHHLLRQLAACGLHPDAPPVWQSQRVVAYQNALDTLIAQGWAYGCACSRKAIAQNPTHAPQPQAPQPPRHAELRYPGTCRTGLAPGQSARAWRLRTDSAGEIRWHDRRLGWQAQRLEAVVGDFVLRRADGLFAYQLAVVLDDAAQGVSHVVRGEDLTDNTARQMHLQHALQLPTPRYMHTPLVLGDNGEKLSKQNGAQPIATDTPAAALAALQRAAQVLGLAATAPGSSVHEALAAWQAQWAATWREPSR